MSVSVSKIEISKYKPNVPKRFEHLAPKELISEHMEFQINNVSNAISNAIRRTITSELLVKAMKVDLKNINDFEDSEKVHEDKFIISDMIESRITMIPLRQDVPKNAMFKLYYHNKSHEVAKVKTSELVQVSGETLKIMPFNTNIDLLHLQPGKKVKINKIRINEDYGYNFAPYTVAVNAVSVAVDQVPYNAYKKEGIKSSLSNPQVWKIAFNTNGTSPCKTIIKNACDNLIERVQLINDYLKLIENANDEYILHIKGESDTIGNLLMKTITTLFPDIISVTYSTETFTRELTVRIRCDEDISTIYEITIKHIVKIFTDIKKYF